MSRRYIYRKFITTRVMICALLMGLVGLATAPLRAQTAEIDEIRSLLTQAEATGHVNSKAYLDQQVNLARAYFGYDPTGAIPVATKAIQLAEVLGDQRQLAISHWILAFSHIRIGQIGPDFLHISKALDISRTIKDVSLEVDALRLKGIHYDYRNDTVRSLESLLESFDLALKHNFFGKAAIAKNNIGYVLIKADRSGEAISHLRRAVELGEKSGDKRNLGLSLTNLGLALVNTGAPEEAIVIIERGLALGAEINNMAIISYGNAGLGRAYAAVGQSVKAEEVYKAAIADDRLHQFPEYIVKTYLALGELYIATGRDRQAEEVYLLGIEKLKGLSIFRAHLSLYGQLSDLFKLKGDYKQALDYASQYRKLQDEILKVDSDRVGENMDRIIKSKEQAEALRRSKSEQLMQSVQLREQQKSNYIISLALVSAILLLFILAILYRLRRRHHKLSQERNLRLTLEAKQMEGEAIAVKAIVDAKSKIFANTGHDLKNPLATILGFADLLKKERLTEYQYQIVDYIDKSANQQFSLLNDILDLAQFEAGVFKVSPKSVYLTEFLASYIAGWSAQAQAKGLNFEEHFDGDFDFVMELPVDRVVQILGNFISNALKFTVHGAISLTVKIEQEGQLRFTVTDTGIGCSKDALDGLFVRFNQADKASEGQVDNMGKSAGLGLSICEELVHYWQGEIGVRSVEGAGSEFFFTVPYKIGDEGSLDI